MIKATVFLFSLTIMLPIISCSEKETIIEEGLTETPEQLYVIAKLDLDAELYEEAKLKFENINLDLCYNCQTLVKKITGEIITNTKNFHEILDINDSNIESNINMKKVDIYGRPLNWRKISNAYKKEQNYTCEKCGFGENDLLSNYDRRYIHTHHIDSYDLLNLTASIDFVGDKWGLDFKILNATDEDGVNSSMTDVFGVAATGLELIPPRQFMVRLSMSY